MSKLELLFKDFEFEADGYSEFVIRDLIKSSNTKLTIYNGLPLNTEIRVFYDFDNKKVMYSHNYWDYDYCKNNLSPSDRLILENEKNIAFQFYWRSNVLFIFGRSGASVRAERIRGAFCILG